jgi:hypothetical protein
VIVAIEIKEQHIVTSRRDRTQLFKTMFLFQTRLQRRCEDSLCCQKEGKDLLYLRLFCSFPHFSGPL